MSTISRRIPQSAKTRHQAITDAKTKMDAVLLLDPADDTLRAATQGELTTKAGPINTAFTARSLAKFELTGAVADKNAKRATLYPLVAGFVDIFKVRVRTGASTAAERALLNLDTTTGNLPPVRKDAELLTVAQNLVTGEQARITAGRPACTEITLAELSTATTAYAAALTLVNNRKQAYDTAQETFVNLCLQADDLILSIWDQVESKYNSENKESQRANAKLWGVVYTLVGPASTVTITVQDMVDDSPVEGMPVRGEEGDVEGLTNALGVVILKDKFIGLETFTTDSPEWQPASITQQLDEEGTYSIVIKVTKV